jgi:hypothetical protein
MLEKINKWHRRHEIAPSLPFWGAFLLAASAALTSQSTPSLNYQDWQCQQSRH